MEAIVNNLIKAVGWSIFHSLWQGAIIYGLLMLAVALIPKLNAKIKHNLAYAAMCLMFAGFCITFFSIFQFPKNEAAAVQQITTAVYNSGTGSFLLSLPQEINNRTEHLFPYLVSVYSIGILFQLLILSFGYRKLLRLKKAERSLVPDEWQLVFEQLGKKLDLRRKVSFYLSANVNVPLVIGYLKPMVLFPVALATQLDVQQVEAILIHELSHIRRNDYLLNLIKTAIETLLFFNPFIWLSGRYINIEREHACDDLVLKFTGTPVTYAHALLKLEILKDKTTPALSMAATGGNQYLYQRIKRITNMKTNYMNAKQQLFAITLTVATVISLAWVNPSKTGAAHKATTSTVRKVEITSQSAKFRPLGKTESKAVAARSAKLADEDTTKKKKRFKIVTVDAKGEKKEYDSIKEMPDSLRQEVISETFLNKDDFRYDFKIDSSINASMSYIKSPEFKKVMKDAQNQAHIMVMKFNSAEWKKHQAEDMKKLQKDMKKMTEDMRKKFDSPEWKKQQADLRKHAEALHKKFDSPEFKKQIEDIKKLHESPEYKELREKFEKDLEKLKEEKGIKTEIREDVTIIKPN